MERPCRRFTTKENTTSVRDAQYQCITPLFGSKPASPRALRDADAQGRVPEGSGTASIGLRDGDHASGAVP